MKAASDVHKGYPKFFRLNPIIKWNYEQVWTFIKDFQVPYCHLYDEGISRLMKATPTWEIRTTLLKIKHFMMRNAGCTKRPVKLSRLQKGHLASTSPIQISNDTVFKQMNYDAKISS